MSSETPPIEAINNTKWAIAAKVPVSALEVMRHKLSESVQIAGGRTKPVRIDGSRIISGKRGMSVLLILDTELGDATWQARKLSMAYETPVYFLDFYREVKPAMWRIDDTREKRERRAPARFLESYGIPAPRPAPRPEPPAAPPAISIGVFEGATLNQARKVLPDKRHLLSASSRGVIARGDYAVIELRVKLQCRLFWLTYYRVDGSFDCLITGPDNDEWFSSDPTPAEIGSTVRIDSILGETTLEGILRVLDIPREALFPEGGGVAEVAQRSSVAAGTAPSSQEMPPPDAVPSSQEVPTPDTVPSSQEAPSPNDYAAAAGTLRGMSGELTLIMEDIELPGGLEIGARHVDARGMKIDFALQGARGRKAKLEVKAWSREAWERELVDIRNVDPASAVGHMIAQLRAARATGVPVYLAVLDVIGNRLADLRRLLDCHELDDVTVLTFPESKFEKTFGALRAGLRIPAAVTPSLADQIAEVDGE